MPAASEASGGSTFVDTNIWVYAHLKAPDEPRHERALGLLKADADLIISPQVVAEYYSVMLRNKRPDVWIQANLRVIFARTRLQAANAEVLSTALIALGSSPRSWGTLDRSCVGRCRCRFIPTLVGNTRPCPSRACRTSVHPHHSVNLASGRWADGSSPRSRGTRASR